MTTAHPREYINKASRALLVVGMLLILGLGAFVRLELVRDRSAAEARLKSELEAQAQLAETAVMERVRKVDTAILALRVSITSHGFADVAQILSSLGETGLIDIATAIVVTDTHGQALQVDGKPPPSSFSVADRDYFIRLRDGNDVLAISDPIRSRVSNSHIVAFARRLNGPDNEFAGVIAVGVKPETLLGAGLPARNSHQEILTLMSDQGVVLSRSRDHEQFLGKHIGEEALKTLRSGEVVYSIQPSPTDGRLRAHALRKVSGVPLYVAVGDTFDGIKAQLAPRRQALLISSGAVALLLLLLLWQAWGYTQRRTRQVRELAALKSQLELAQDVAGVGSWVWDIAGGRMSASRQIYALLGAAPGQLTSDFESFMAFAPEHEREAILSAFRTLLKTGRCEHIHHVKRGDGELRLFMQSASVTERDPDGWARTVIGTCRDITDERHAQAQIEARERRLEAIIGSLAEGVVVRDREGRITLVNDAAARLAGVPRESLLGQRPESATWEMVDEHGQTLAPDQYPSMVSMSSATQIDHQLYGIRGTGPRPAWISISTRLLASDGDVGEGGDAVVASMADVTRLREAERENRLAAAVFTHVSQAIVITDGNAQILRINRAFTEAFGYSVEEAVGSTTGILRSKRHDDAYYEAMWRQLCAEGYWRGEIWNRHKNGQPVPFLASITRINEPVSRETRYVAVYTDLHDQKAAESALRWQADHDALTGLPNRRMLTDRLETALALAKRNNSIVAVAFIDLDRFKPVNDDYGHLAGDFLLQIVADRMRGVLRASDSLARVGGDEFIAVLGEVSSISGVRRALAGLLAAVAEPVAWEGADLQVGCSIGVAFWPDDGDDVTALIEAADAAMYHAKASGRGRIVCAGDIEKDGGDSSS